MDEIDNHFHYQSKQNEFAIASENRSR